MGKMEDKKKKLENVSTDQIQPMIYISGNPKLCYVKI